MLRLSPPRGELLADADLFQATVGGAESNVAVALAALGGRVAWIGGLPDHALGARWPASCGPAAWTRRASCGARRAASACTGRRARRRGRPWSSTTARARRRRRSARGPGGTPRRRHPCRRLRRHGGARPHGAALAAALPGARRPARRAPLPRHQLPLPAVARRARPPGAAGAGRAGGGGGQFGRRRASRRSASKAADGDLAATLQREVAPQAELAVVTHGDRGASAWSATHGTVSPAGHDVEVVDGLGAGDALLAGLVWSDLEGRPPGDGLAAGAPGPHWPAPCAATTRASRRPTSSACCGTTGRRRPGDAARRLRDPAAPPAHHRHRSRDAGVEHIARAVWAGGDRPGRG